MYMQYITVTILCYIFIAPPQKNNEHGSGFADRRR